MADEPTDLVHLLIRNIPQDYHSSDLRRFFSEFVETNRFDCFHFRHRPEIKIDRSAAAGEGEGEGDGDAKGTSTTRCCIVRAKASHAAGLIKRYNDTHWTNTDGEETESKCFVVKVKVCDGKDEDQGPSSEGVALTEKDLQTILELRPPGVMPRGNVGTSTEYFLRAIQQCKLPTKIIAKLKLEFPRSRRRRIYGSVEYAYDREDAEREERLKRREEGGGKRYLDREKIARLNVAGPSCEGAKAASEDHSDDDDDTCEEWERHEALHNDMEARRADPRHGHMDISQQPGTKERLFEEEMEVTWDKGSSGLVFYTDAQVWIRRVRNQSTKWCQIG